MSLKETFNAVSGFFTRERIEYAVIGAFSLYDYGYVQATRDIDFVTRLKDKRKAMAFLVREI